MDNLILIQKKKKMNRLIMSLFIIVMGLIILFLGMGLSVSLGAKHIDLSTVFNSLLSPGDDINSKIIRDIRLPRVIAAALVGAFLAVSGAIMQGITRNPIADPSIMGITQGATFTIAIAFAIDRKSVV